MGERIAVKPGSTFERTSSQKRQLALQTEKSTVGVSILHDLAVADSTIAQTADSQLSHSSTSSLEELGAPGPLGTAPQQGGAVEGQAGGRPAPAAESRHRCSHVGEEDGKCTGSAVEEVPAGSGGNDEHMYRGPSDSLGG